MSNYHLTPSWLLTCATNFSSFLEGSKADQQFITVPLVVDSSWPIAVTLPPVSPKPSLYPPGVPDARAEQQLLHYFCVEAAPDLSGYSSFTFWNDLVLPACHQEPGIQHAVLALSAFHREYVVNRSANTQNGGMNPEALVQYNKALRQLQTYLKNRTAPSKRLVLICCVLFYCIEISRGDYDTALRHVKSGFHILEEWKKTQETLDTSPDESLEDLMQVLARLDLQVRIFEGGKPPHIVLTSLEERLGLRQCVPASFRSLLEAWAAMDKLTNVSHRWG